MAGSSRQDSLEKRSAEARKILAKYPDRLPVICLRAPSCASSTVDAGAFARLPEQKKFLVPNSMTVHGLRDTIRTHIKDSVQVTVDVESIHISASGTLLGDEKLQDTYEKRKAEDCFLYLHFGLGSFDGNSPSAVTAARPSKDVADSPSGSAASRPSNDAEDSIFARTASRPSKDKAQRPSKDSGREARKLLAKHPNNVPVICTKAVGSSVPDIAKNKFLVPCSMGVREFAGTVLSSVEKGTDEPPTAISLAVDDNIIEGDPNMQEVYAQHKSSDGFLYLIYDSKMAPRPSTPPASDSSSSIQPPPVPASSVPEKPAEEETPAREESLQDEAAEDTRVEPADDEISGQPSPSLRQAEKEARSDSMDNEDICRASPSLQKAVEEARLQTTDDGTMSQPSPSLRQAVAEARLDSICDEDTCRPSLHVTTEASAPLTQSTVSQDEEKEDVEGPTPQVESTGSQKDDDEEVPPPAGEPAAETGGTPSPQPGPSSSGTISIHLPDNDPDAPVDFCGAARAGSSDTSPKAQSSLSLGLPDEALSDHAQDLPMPPIHKPVAETPSFGSRQPPERPERHAGAARAETNRMLEKHPGRIPVFCTKGRPDVPDIGRTKFLVPGTMLCSEFKYLIHRQLRDSTGGDIGIYETIYLFLDNVSPKTGMTMAELHARYKKDDNYLHISYSLENTLGRM